MILHVTNSVSKFSTYCIFSGAKVGLPSLFVSGCYYPAVTLWYTGTLCLLIWLTLYIVYTLWYTGILCLLIWLTLYIVQVSVAAGEVPESNPTITVDFKISQLSVSGLKVNRLDMYGEVSTCL